MLYTCSCYIHIHVVVYTLYMNIFVVFTRCCEMYKEIDGSFSLSTRQQLLSAVIISVQCHSFQQNMSCASLICMHVFQLSAQHTRLPVFTSTLCIVIVLFLYRQTNNYIWLIIEQSVTLRYQCDFNVLQLLAYSTSCLTLSCYTTDTNNHWLLISSLNKLQ